MRYLSILLIALSISSNACAQNWNDPDELGMMQWRLDQIHSEDSQYYSKWQWEPSPQYTLPSPGSSPNPLLDYTDPQVESSVSIQSDGNYYGQIQQQSEFQQEQLSRSFQNGLELGMESSSSAPSHYSYSPQNYSTGSNLLPAYPEPNYSTSHNALSSKSQPNKDVQPPKKIEIQESAFQKSMNSYINDLLTSANKSRPLGPTPTPIGVTFGSPKSDVVEALQRDVFLNYNFSKNLITDADEVTGYGGSIAGYPLQSARFDFHNGLLQECSFYLKQPTNSIYTNYRALCRKLESKYGKPYEDTIESKASSEYISRIITAAFMQEPEGRDSLIETGSIECLSEWWTRDYNILLTLQRDSLEIYYYENSERPLIGNVNHSEDY